ncbi:MAG TPA: AbgT family transporter [Bacteroidales bacterium]|nr:AbgT family transporter [Bacteroidales bacterium]
MNKENKTKSNGLLKKILDKVEIVGNKLPHPATLFLILIGVVLLLSWIFGGVSVLRPGTGGATGTPEDFIVVNNLITKEGIQRIFTNMVSVFAGFPPLGLVLVVGLGIGVAEHSGMIATALKFFVSKVPKYLITFTIVTAGMLSSVAADAGYVVLIPMGAAIFYGLGRHPLAGIAAAFAGVAGGFGANILPTGLDPMMAAFTETAARIIEPGYTVNPLSNYFFLAASVPLVGIVGTWVTEKIVVPRLGEYKPQEGLDHSEINNSVATKERLALKWSMLSILVMLALIAWAIIPSDGILRGELDPVTGVASMLPFYNSLVPIMFIIFLVAGLVYGIVAKTIKSDKDVATMTAKAMSTMGMYIVIAFVAALFIAFFNWSHLGSVLAIKGSETLQAIGFTGAPLIVAFILLTSLINIAIGSASAKWALMAPIFVPMFMLLGYSPEMVQAAYRIGDSYSNIITPLLPYFPLIIVFAQKYDKSVGIGTLIAMMLPYSIAFILTRIPFFLAWVWLELPVGIEGPLRYELPQTVPAPTVLIPLQSGGEIPENTLLISSFSQAVKGN